MPHGRWDVDALAAWAAAGDAPARFGAFLHTHDEFDAAALGLSAGEAMAADPQQRVRKS